MTRLSPVRADIGVVGAGVEVRRLVVERPLSGTVCREITVRTIFSAANPFDRRKRGGKKLTFLNGAAC